MFGKFRVAVWCVLLSVATLFLLASLATADGRVVPSTDRLPLGDWTYDAMMKLAADGLVPGLSSRVFQGDRLFSRMEMAGILASIIETSEERDLGAGSVALINHLVSEFHPELALLDQAVLEKWSGRSNLITLPWEGDSFLLGYLKAPMDDHTDSGSRTVTPHRVSGFMNMSAHSFGMVTLADKEEKFFQEFRDGSTPDRFLIRGFGRTLTWSIGREYLSWGPAYGGSAILSDNSPSLVQVRGAGEIDFGKLLGRVKITQFVSSFDDSDRTVYLLGRRYQRPLSPRWHVGISETAKVSGTPNPLMLVMPFYLYQHLAGGAGSKADRTINTLYATDLTYLDRHGNQMYGELAVDDITAPRLISDDYSRPRKIAYTLGFYAPKVFGGDRPWNIRAEYIFVDRLMYEATREDLPELAYTHDGEIIGHPIGRNSKALYLRGEHYLSDRFSLIAEYLDQQQTDAGPPERGKRRVFSLTTSYDIAPDKSVSLRVAPYDIALPDGTFRDGTEYQLRASFAF